MGNTGHILKLIKIIHAQINNIKQETEFSEIKMGSRIYELQTVKEKKDHLKTLE